VTAAFDPARSLRALHDADVRFVVIGGVAGATHGSPSVTQDLDVCPDREAVNLGRLAYVLRSLHARLRGADDDPSFVLDARTLAAGDHFTFATDAGDLDVLLTPAGTDGYEDLIRDADVVDLEGFEASVASVDALIRMKRAAGRPKDRAELEILGALRDELGSA
jgi:predicted nucleotidyltransferase